MLLLSLHLSVIRPCHRYSISGLFLQAKFCFHSVSQSVYPLVMSMYCIKTAYVQLMSGMVGPRIRVLDGGPDPPQ